MQLGRNLFIAGAVCSLAWCAPRAAAETRQPTKDPGNAAAEVVVTRPGGVPYAFVRFTDGVGVGLGTPLDEPECPIDFMMCGIQNPQFDDTGGMGEPDLFDCWVEFSSSASPGPGDPDNAAGAIEQVVGVLDGNAALIRENDSFLTLIEQQFCLPACATRICFDIVGAYDQDAGIPPNIDAPDVFEVFLFERVNPAPGGASFELVTFDADAGGGVQTWDLLGVAGQGTTPNPFDPDPPTGQGAFSFLNIQEPIEVDTAIDPDGREGGFEQVDFVTPFDELSDQGPIDISNLNDPPCLDFPTCTLGVGRVYTPGMFERAVFDPVLGTFSLGMIEPVTVETITDEPGRQPFTRVCIDVAPVAPDTEDIAMGSGNAERTFLLRFAWASNDVDDEGIVTIDNFTTETTIGACCLPDAMCVDVCPFECTELGGTFCDGVLCNETICGACCLPDGSCQVRCERDCMVPPNLVFFPNQPCSPDLCDPPDGDGCDDPCLIWHNGDPAEPGTVCVPALGRPSFDFVGTGGFFRAADDFELPEGTDYFFDHIAVGIYFTPMMQGNEPIMKLEVYSDCDGKPDELLFCVDGDDVTYDLVNPQPTGIGDALLYTVTFNNIEENQGSVELVGRRIWLSPVGSPDGAPGDCDPPGTAVGDGDSSAAGQYLWSFGDWPDPLGDPTRMAPVVQGVQPQVLFMGATDWQDGDGSDPSSCPTCVDCCVDLAFIIRGQCCWHIIDQGDPDLDLTDGGGKRSERPVDDTCFYVRAADDFHVPFAKGPLTICRIEGWIATTCPLDKLQAEIYLDACGMPGCENDGSIPGARTPTAARSPSSASTPSTACRSARCRPTRPSTTSASTCPSTASPSATPTRCSPRATTGCRSPAARPGSPRASARSGSSRTRSPRTPATTSTATRASLSTCSSAPTGRATATTPSPATASSCPSPTAHPRRACATSPSACGSRSSAGTTSARRRPRPRRPCPSAAPGAGHRPSTMAGSSARRRCTGATPTATATSTNRTSPPSSTPSAPAGTRDEHRHDRNQPRRPHAAAPPHA